MFVLFLVGCLGVTAAVFVFYGAALGLSELLQDRLWLGYLISGAFFFLFTSTLLWGLRTRLRRKLKKRIASYEEEASARGLGNLFDPAPFIREHPWSSAGIAVATGFVASQPWKEGKEVKETKEASDGPEKTFETTPPPPASPTSDIMSSLMAIVAEVLTAALLPIVTDFFSQWTKAGQRKE